MPAIDKFKFAKWAATQANYCGVNPHYVVAIAQLRSQISDDVVGQCVGVYRFTQIVWNKNCVYDELGFDFNPTDIADWGFQTQIFAAMSHGILEKFVDKRKRMPTVIELYLDQLAAEGVPLPVDSAIDVLVQDLDRALKETAPAILKTEADLLTDVAIPAAPGLAPELVLFRRRLGMMTLRGHLIVPIQTALIERGHLAAIDATGHRNDDGIFGADTEAAVERWQSQRGFSSTGAITVAQWRELTSRPVPDIYEFCAQVTASFEGTSFGGVNVNDIDDTVLTFGYHGYTLKSGSFLELLKKIDGKHPDLLDRCFDVAQAQQLRSLLKMSDAQAVAAGRGIFRNGPNLLPGWKAAFEGFGATPECQAAQIEFSRDTYWAKSEKLRAILNVSAPLSCALCFDVGIQNGDKTQQARDAAAKLKPADGEPERRRVFAAQIVKFYDGKRFQNDVRDRKATLAKGTGEVHGGKYNLADWGFAETESAEVDDTSVGPQAPSDNTTFDAWYALQFPGMTAFSPAEFLVKGGRNAINHLNSDPPRALWPNIVPTIKVLLELKRRLGQPAITLNSVYRNREYNRSVGGARDSQHMKFTAVDLVVHNGQSPVQWAKELQKMRKEGFFKGGIGIYSSFVHVDTRGHNADWA